MPFKEKGRGKSYVKWTHLHLAKGHFKIYKVESLWILLWAFGFFILFTVTISVIPGRALFLALHFPLCVSCHTSLVFLMMSFSWHILLNRKLDHQGLTDFPTCIRRRQWDLRRKHAKAGSRCTDFHLHYILCCNSHSSVLLLPLIKEHVEWFIKLGDALYIIKLILFLHVHAEVIKELLQGFNWSDWKTGSVSVSI